MFISPPDYPSGGGGAITLCQGKRFHLLTWFFALNVFLSRRTKVFISAPGPPSGIRSTSFGQSKSFHLFLVLCLVLMYSILPGEGISFISSGSLSEANVLFSAGFRVY